MVMTALEDEDTQRGGLVSVNFNVGSHHGLDREFVAKACQLVNQLPVKFVSMHFCYNDPQLEFLLSLATHVLDSKTRTRLRPHCGLALECIYQLASFGITKDILPISTTSGKVKRDAHRLFLQRPVEPGTLILIRHGESMWNANQTFTGWADPDLSERGWREAEHAAR